MHSTSRQAKTGAGAVAASEGPNKEQQQQQQVNSVAKLSGLATIEASSVAAVAADSGTLDSVIGATSQSNWQATSSRQINERGAQVASHRIKVTLSLPRNSTSDEAIQATSEASLEEVFSERAQRHEQQQELQQPALFDPKRRQSTATLISAAESSTSLIRRPTQTTNSQTVAATVLAQSASFGSHSVESGPITISSGNASTTTTKPQLDRTIQERELRRIASQRNCTRAKQLASTTDAAIATVGLCEKELPPSPREKKVETTITAAKQQQRRQQQQQLDVAVPNHKQLAIYINGKIRSNSIFCQSSSLGGSFHNIFNRFHHNGNTDNNNNNHSPPSASVTEKSETISSLTTTIKNKKPAASRRRRRRRNRNLDDNEKTSCSNDGGGVVVKEAQSRLRVKKLIGKYLPLAKKQREDSSGSGSSSSGSSSSESNAQEEPLTNKENNITEKNTPEKNLTTTTSYKLNPSSMFLRKAMRYYRLWIYCTNVTILLGTLLFIVAVLYVTSDYRIPLIISERAIGEGHQLFVNNNNNDHHEDDDYIGIRKFPISFTEPSMLVAYVAVAIQAGILQLIGCFGAVRMKEKFIQLFWYMILALTVLDVVFLVYWLLRYDLMIKSLNEHMKFRLNEHFGSFEHFEDEENVNFLSKSINFTNSEQEAPEQTTEFIKFDKIFTNIINRIQSDSRCCGIASPLDYRRTKWRQVKLKQLENKLNWTNTRAAAAAAVSPEAASSADVLAHHQQQMDSVYATLLSRVPLVAGSCCRRRGPRGSEVTTKGGGGGTVKKKRPVILDDSEMPVKVRVPAWAPSSVVEDLQGRSHQHQASSSSRIKQQTAAAAVEGGSLLKEFDQDRDGEGEGEGEGEEVGDQDRVRDLDGDRNRNRDRAEGGEVRLKSLAAIIDERWTSSADSNGWSSMGTNEDEDNGNNNNGYDNEDVSLVVGSLDGTSGDDDDNNNDDKEPDWKLSKQQKRLLAKQDNYNLPSSASAPSGSSLPSGRDRRWAVESSVDSQERVLSRLIEEPNKMGIQIGEDSLNVDDDDEKENEIEASPFSLSVATMQRDDYADYQLDLAQQKQQTDELTLFPFNKLIENGNDRRVNNGSHLKGSSSNGDSLRENEVTPLSKLASLRRSLFHRKSPLIFAAGRRRSQNDNDYHHNNGEPSLLAKNTDTTKGNSGGGSGSQDSHWQEDTFRWPNKLQLNYQQYKTLESYLLAEEETRLSAKREAQVSLLSPSSTPSKVEKVAAQDNRSRRSIFSSLIGATTEQDANNTNTAKNSADQLDGRKKVAPPDPRQRAMEQLRAALEENSELGCAPRSHFDNATIYTRGCHEPIRVWLDRSGHILFVTGFCVLSMLKLFSLLLLRLELREMIHKIRVLKGMATEYNALHDLEAYLPRPSVCAQAAELTSGGVTAAVLPAASATLAAATGGGGGQPGRICSGSFSEAVAAATAAAAAAAAAATANNNPQQLSASSIVGVGGGPCRASSMKTVTSTMLTPFMCPRSSSVSAAHLQALQQQQQQQRFCSGSSSLRSDLFQQPGGGTMSRRHTAISMCPAAAAAAHHLMSRRGTYVPNAFPPLVSPVLSLGFPNLSQHRHSAHTVHSLSNNGNNSIMTLLNPSSGKQQQQQQRRPSSTSSAQQQQNRISSAAGPRSRHYLGDMARNADEAQGSLDSNQSSGRFFLSTSGGCKLEMTTAARNASSDERQQQQLLYPTFKRQSSTGAQSACNFSLDPRPAASLLAESRRSIH